MTSLYAKCLGGHMNGAYRISSKSYLTTVFQWISALSSGQSCIAVIRTIREFGIKPTS